MLFNRIWWITFIFDVLSSYFFGNFRSFLRKLSPFLILLLSTVSFMFPFWFSLSVLFSKENSDCSFELYTLSFTLSTEVIFFQLFLVHEKVVIAFLVSLRRGDRGIIICYVLLLLFLFVIISLSFFDVSINVVIGNLFFNDIFSFRELVHIFVFSLVYIRFF